MGFVDFRSYLEVAVRLCKFCIEFTVLCLSSFLIAKTDCLVTSVSRPISALGFLYSEGVAESCSDSKNDE